jgi:hypothetical protein
VAADLEVDTPLGGVEPDVIDDPRRLQASALVNRASTAMPMDSSSCSNPPGGHVHRPTSGLHMPTGLDDQESL